MPTALAPAPTRSNQSFTLQWGSMVLIPCQVMTGTETTRVARKEFIETFGENGSGVQLVEVGRAPIRKDTGAVVDHAEVGRYATADNGELVLWTDEEGAACTSPKGSAEIVSFVKRSDIGQYLAENQAQVRPKKEKGKVSPAADRAFALLMQTMKSMKVVALVKVAMRGPARYALLDERGTFTLIYTADAIRQDAPLTAAEHKFDKAEIEMAKTLIEMIGIDTPVLTDDTAPVVQAAVNAKSSGKPAPVMEAPVATGDDLMAALQASIAADKAAKAKVA